MAISEYFFKEILMAGIMILMYRLVNEDYRTLFMGALSYVENKAGKDGVESPIITESNGLYDFDQYTPKLQIREI